MTSSDRSAVARIAALTRWSREDPREGIKPARRGFMQRFLDEVDPNQELPERERQRRAEAAMRAYMGRLALRSAKARRRKAVRS